RYSNACPPTWAGLQRSAIRSRRRSSCRNRVSRGSPGSTAREPIPRSRPTCPPRGEAEPYRGEADPRKGRGHWQSDRSRAEDAQEGDDQGRSLPGDEAPRVLREALGQTQEKASPGPQEAPPRAEALAGR